MSAQFWDSLSPQEQIALREVARPRSFSPRQPLLNEGDDSDHVLLITAGWAKVISTTEDGHQMVMGVRGPGDLVGEDAALAAVPRPATVWTLSPVRALAIPFARFLAFLDAHPAAWRTLTTTQIHRLAEAERRIKWQASGLDATQRLALLLTELAELSTVHAPPHPDGSIDIAPPLS
ncbi:Crp/Fnr family transcriptional regulator, partial [Actinomadura nitritigenes]|uniref:Crp/Fnr family transcriptional regulator n=1 Tax=Actinomadura nitritigenes TaxID=134602 RepID=UPI003D93294A